MRLAQGALLSGFGRTLGKISAGEVVEESIEMLASSMLSSRKLSGLGFQGRISLVRSSKIMCFSQAIAYSLGVRTATCLN